MNNYDMPYCSYCDCSPKIAYNVRGEWYCENCIQKDNLLNIFQDDIRRRINKDSR